MEEERRGIIRWLNAHKEQLAMVGISAFAIGLIILGIKKKETLTKAWSSLKASALRRPTDSLGAEMARMGLGPLLNQAIGKNGLEATGAYRASTPPFDVRHQVRNLPEDWHPSPQKIAEVAELGIDLFPNQTFMTTYWKGGMAA